MSHWRVKLQMTQHFISKYFSICHPRTKHISHVWIPAGVSLRKTNPHTVSLFVDSYSGVSVSFLSQICQRLYIAVGCHSSVSCFFLSFLSPPLTPSFIPSFTNWYFCDFVLLYAIEAFIISTDYCPRKLGVFTRVHFCFPLNLLDFCVSHRHVWKHLETLDSSKPRFSGHPGLLTAQVQVFIGRLLIFTDSCPPSFLLRMIAST